MARKKDVKEDIKETVTTPSLKRVKIEGTNVITYKEDK